LQGPFDLLVLKSCRAKYYRLAAASRRQVDAEKQDWQRISLAITTALKAT
jgi:hypothetical protein